MFSFPQIDPETTGQVLKMPVPLDKYLDASFDQGQHDSAFNSILRIGEINADNADPNSMTLTPDEANQAYGVGDLKFTEPVKESVAQTLNQRKKAEMDRNFLLSNGTSGGRFVPGMAASIMGGMANPIDLSLAFVPFVGEERAATRVAEAGGGAIRQALARGLITREAISAAGVPAPVLASHVLQGTLNQSLFEIPNLIASNQDHADYGLEDATRNVIGGGIFAGALHAAGSLLRKVSTSTQQVMMRDAMNQFLKDEDIRVDNYVHLDEEAIRQNVKFDEEGALRDAQGSINEADLKKAIFDKYHETPQQAAVMLSNGDIHAGMFHGDAWGKVPKEDFDRVSTGELAAQEGFTTDTGRFVSRDDAARLMGVSEHLTSEAMHGTSDESFLSEEEHHLFNHYLEEGRPKADAWNKVMAYRFQNQERFFFDRPDIQEKLNAERQNQVQQFVEKARSNYDPKTQFTQAARAEIEKQQAQGKILTQEQIDKYLSPDKPFAEQSGEMISKDASNLKQNLPPHPDYPEYEKIKQQLKDIPNTIENFNKKSELSKQLEEIKNRNGGMPPEKNYISPEDQKILDSIPKPQSNAIDAAVDCITQKLI